MKHMTACPKHTAGKCTWTSTECNHREAHDWNVGCIERPLWSGCPERCTPVKADCYKCRHRGTIPGDCHSRCNHPEVHQDTNMFGALFDMIAGKNDGAAAKLEIIGDPHGIRNAWFMWPANFDPVWLRNCNGYEEKEKPEEYVAHCTCGKAMGPVSMPETTRMCPACLAWMREP